MLLNPELVMFCVVFVCRKTNKEYALKIISKAKVKGKVSKKHIL